MTVTSLGEIRLSPIKENGKFVFINNEVRINGKLNKGDSIKIFVDAYEMNNGKYLLKNTTPPFSQIVVRGALIQHEHAAQFSTVDELYTRVSEMYKNQFYFGKVEI